MAYPEIFWEYRFQQGILGQEPKGIILNFEEQFSVINMHGWHGEGLFTTGNVINMYLSIVLDILLGESSFKINKDF